MAIKKPLIKSRKPAEEEPAPKKSLLKKRPAPVEEEDEEEAAEEEEEEEAPKKSLKKKAAPVEEEEEEEEAPRRTAKKGKKKSSKSFADMFDETAPGGGIFPNGKFKMYLNGFELEGEIAADGEEQEDDLVVFATFEGHEDEEECAGKTIRSRYGIFKDGELGQGVPFLKGDLDTLGYENVVLADLEEIFSDVEANRPEVVVNVKTKNGYTNAFLQGLADGE